MTQVKTEASEKFEDFFESIEKFKAIRIKHKQTNTTDIMKNLLTTIKDSFESFKNEAASQIEKGNKAAGVRARKISLTIEKALKNFRKKSIDEANK